ncbi:hypothetical protein [Hymenobacter volaticus]|uniref:DUF308 domain-containing protein n=1 Tax=Hymenobacter volaticus TaxID=2932254 RepID=A0ABY4G1R1_9BACT|nr:hypothetical protein [Hymenobacter volaticus]UOQ64609.1 hypothetical protein MUN86_13585 [Hymenobacter volaticus]
MEPNPLPQPPKKPADKESVTWPLILNLGILLLVAVFEGIDSLPMAIGALVLLNGLTGAIMMLSGNRMHYALAFFLSGLLLLLIGFGVCGLLLSNMKGGH